MVYTYFKDCVVQAGAKTGTAQLGSDIKNNGVFVCFAPYDEPEVALAIVIEKGGAGSALASTAVKILNSYFTPDDSASSIQPENQLIASEPIGKQHRFRPLVQHSEYTSGFLSDIKESLFRGSASSLVNFFVKEEKLSAEEIEELIELLKVKQ